MCVLLLTTNIVCPLSTEVYDNMMHEVVKLLNTPFNPQIFLYLILRSAHAVVDRRQSDGSNQAIHLQLRGIG